MSMVWVALSGYHATLTYHTDVLELGFQWGGRLRSTWGQENSRIGEGYGKGETLPGPAALLTTWATLRSSRGFRVRQCASVFQGIAACAWPGSDTKTEWGGWIELLDAILSMLAQWYAAPASKLFLLHGNFGGTAGATRSRRRHERAGS